MHIKSMLVRSLAACTTIAIAIAALPVVAADDVSLFKTTLTPLGAERAGSADGKIPAWTGGLTTAVKEYAPGHPGDPFPSEKPLFSITGSDAAKYADQLTEGQKFLLKRYPDYRIDVYPTHRTFAAPQAVYDAFAKNANRSKLEPDGGITGAWGAPPFPFPKTGAEVMWDHNLRWAGILIHSIGDDYTVGPNGETTLTSVDDVYIQSPYYFPNVTSTPREPLMYRVSSIGPPIKVGTQLVTRADINSDKSVSWLLLTGQRRVRQLPNACCDTPLPQLDGALFFDEGPLFAGRLTDFDWKIVGKKEMFLPYNDNRANNAEPRELLGKKTLNPDLVRWELHRVIVVAATLKPGHRHVMARSLYYVDEDSYTALLSDRFDAHGNLARSGIMLPTMFPETPIMWGQAWGAYDFTNGTYAMANVHQAAHFLKARPDTYFTPEAMAGESAR